VAHLPTADPDALYVLLTQDCDILHHDYVAEPDVELHVARAITEPDGNLFHAKNPRRLQFKIANRIFEIKIHERCHVPRACLVSYAPRDLTLTEDDIRTIIRWTANRYLRSAFPDTFNQRLAAAKGSMKRIETALKRDGSVITGIFLRVDPPDEIAPEERYQVIMRLTAREEVFEQPEPETRALELTELIRHEFDRVDGIEIVDYELVSEANFSLADLRATLRWDYDYLSYREGTLDDTVPTAI
jgi:hypothetical protein